MDIRVLKPSDIPHVQLTNITNLPENYFCKYYLYHAMSWPQLSYVAVDVSCAFSYTTSISPLSPISLFFVICEIYCPCFEIRTMRFLSLDCSKIAFPRLPFNTVSSIIFSTIGA
jgi:hypothetical protein